MLQQSHRKGVGDLGAFRLWCGRRPLRHRRDVVGAGAEQLADIGAGFGAAEQKALHLGAAERAQHSFCYRVSTPSATVVMLREAAMLTTACTIAAEPSVSARSATKQRSILILSNGKRFQIAQRRIAGAEIVERDAHAERAQVVQDGAARSRRLDQHRFGDLELEPVAPAGRKRRARLRSSATSVGVLELHRRDVDGEPDMVRPARGFAQAVRSTHSPIARSGRYLPRPE